MKDLLITHTDLDGISPIILLKLCNVEFDFELKEIYEIEEYMNNLLDSDLNIYNNIYITDLTIPIIIYDKINKSEFRDKFKIFDHHKTHMYATKYNYVTINVDECGTTLFYNYLKQKYKLNKKIINSYCEHVKNIDIWLWQEKNDTIAKKISDLLDIYGKTRFIDEMYKKLKKEKKFSLNKFENKLLDIEQDKINRYILKKEKEMIILEYDKYKIGLIFNEKYKSELGNTLSIKYPNLDFIVMINMSGGISFRCFKDIDLTTVANKLGGGGHAKASGAPIPSEYKIEFIKKIFKGCVIDESNESNNR